MPTPRLTVDSLLRSDAEDRNHFTESDHTDLYTVETRREALLSQLRTLEQPHSTAESLLSAFNTEEAPSDLSETDLYRRQAYELTQASVAGEQALLQQQRTVCQDLRDDINQLPLEVQHVCQLLEGFLEEEVMREGQREPRGALRGRRHNKKGVSLRDVFASPDSRDAQELYRLGLKSSGEIKRALYLVGKSEDEHRKWELQQLHQMEDEKHSHDVALERKRQEALGADVIAHLREARLNSSSKKDMDVNQWMQTKLLNSGSSEVDLTVAQRELRGWRSGSLAGGAAGASQVTGSLKGFFNAALQSQEELMGRAKAMEDAPVSTHEGLVDAHITGEHQDLPTTELLKLEHTDQTIGQVHEARLPSARWHHAHELGVFDERDDRKHEGILHRCCNNDDTPDDVSIVAVVLICHVGHDANRMRTLAALPGTYAQKFGEVRTGSLQREIGLSNVLLAHQSASSSREVQHEVEDAISKWRHGADGRRPAQKGCHEVKSALECCLFYDASGGEYDTEKCLAKDGGGSFTTGTPCVAALWLHGHLREAVNAKIPEEELPVDVWLKLRLEGKTAGAQRPGNLAPDLEAKLEKKASERVAMQELYNKWEDNFKATAEHQDLARAPARDAVSYPLSRGLSPDLVDFVSGGSAPF
eukprot:gene7282-8671_t